MSYRWQTCGKCFIAYEFYQKGSIVPPCPHCGYPELKTREEYLKSMGVPSKQVQQQTTNTEALYEAHENSTEQLTAH